MAGVTFIRGKKADLAQRPIVNGQILFETDQEENNRVLMDIQNESGEDERIFFGGAIPDWVGTLAEYTQLPQTKLTDGKSYYITDYPSDNSSVINDSTTSSTTKTWSANKLNTEFTAINSTLSTKQATVSSLVPGVSVIAGQTNVKQFGHLVMGRIRMSTTSGINAWTNMLEITGVDKPTSDTYLQVLIDDTDKKNLLGLITNGDNKFKITDSIVANKNYVIFVWYIV